jgi:hypothetical protein
MKEKIINNKLLIILIMAMLIIIPISYAIHRTQKNSSGNLATATWNVTLNQSNNNYLSIARDTNNNQVSYTIEVTSTSQVDMVYSIVVEDLPAGISVSLDNGTPVQETNNKVIFSDVATILYSDQTKAKSHTITFIADSNTSLVNEQETNINVIARQALQ